MINKEYRCADNVDAPRLSYPRISTTPRYIYVVEDRFIGAKVGATLFPKDRMRSLFTSKASRKMRRVHLFGPLEFGFLVEDEVKKRLSDRALGGEWYSAPFLEIVHVCSDVIAEKDFENKKQNFVVRVRAKSGLNQDLFSTKFGRNVNAASEWERGVTSPSEKQIAAILMFEARIDARAQTHNERG